MSSKKSAIGDKTEWLRSVETAIKGIFGICSIAFGFNVGYLFYSLDPVYFVTGLMYLIFLTWIAGLYGFWLLILKPGIVANREAEAKLIFLNMQRTEEKVTSLMSKDRVGITHDRNQPQKQSKVAHSDDPANLVVDPPPRPWSDIDGSARLEDHTQDSSLDG